MPVVSVVSIEVWSSKACERESSSCVESEPTSTILVSESVESVELEPEVRLQEGMRTMSVPCI